MESHRTDVVVIGGGIAGVGVAAHLAEHCRVIVLERESQPGYHASGRSLAVFSQIYGNSLVRALSSASRDFYYKTPVSFSDDPLISKRGALHIARKDQLDELEKFQRESHSAGIAIFVDRREAIKHSPLLRSDYPERAAFEPDAADIDIHALHQGYLRWLRARGGRLICGANVTQMERNRAWQISTSAGQFEANIIVNAAGAWGDEIARLAGAEAIDLTPMRRTVVAVEAPDSPDVRASCLTIDIDEMFYFKPDAGRLLISPADETPSPPCDVQPDEMDVALAIDRIETATVLNVGRVLSKWAGLRTFTADRSPVSGYDGKVAGFFWLVGQGGYGFQTVPALSKLATAQILGLPVDPALVAHGVEVKDLEPHRFLAHMMRNRTDAGELVGSSKKSASR